MQGASETMHCVTLKVEWGIVNRVQKGHGQQQTPAAPQHTCGFRKCVIRPFDVFKHFEHGNAVDGLIADRQA